MKYILGSQLEEIQDGPVYATGPSPAKGNTTELEPPAVYVVSFAQAQETMQQAGMEYEGELNLKNVCFCKLETQQECLAGSLYIPRLVDVPGKHYRILFFINAKNIVLVDDSEFTIRLINRIRRKKINQGSNKERFLYNFILELIGGNLENLSGYEKRIMEMEEEVLQGKLENFPSLYFPIRKELLILRSYYDEIMDLGKELEANENGFFSKKHLKYFGTITDRADRLMNKTTQLLEYAQQVKEAYQSTVEAKQNKNMQFLTVISTIFFPLTLITGWYGMNFENMPELQSGYPGVIVLSLVVICICIFIFKKKKML